MVLHVFIPSLLVVLIGTILPPTKGNEYEALKNIFEDMSNQYQRYGKRSFQYPPTRHNAYLEPSEWGSTKTPIKEYDFIVVGSGSAGSVIANRLTEVPDWHVLLLEAGKGENDFSRVPMLSAALQYTPYDWQYLMEYDPGFARGMERNLLAYPRGKALGGTSVINYMIYTRGHPLDYDRWAQQGNPGWSYEEVLPYFLKSENATLKRGNYRYHNTNGYLSVEDVYQSPLVGNFVGGGQELGFRFVDYTSDDVVGFSTIQATALNGRRHTVARAFLHPIKSRDNLHIYTSAFVTKILIDPTTKKAYGVEYLRKGKKIVAHAKKEVILSAGTFNSPQLLMLAGVGPKEHLRELGIELLKDLPVGRKMYDHITYVGLAFTINQSLTLNFDKLLDPGTINDFLQHGKGPLTSLGGVEGIAYIKTEHSKDLEDYPDMELLFVDGSINSDLGIVVRRSMRIRDDVYNPLFRHLHNVPNWTIFPMLIHPKSYGYMKLRSKNPFDYPLFYGGYLSDPEGLDLKTLIASIRFIIRLSQTGPFQRIGSKLNERPVPGCELYQFGTDQYWECAIRTLSITLHHQVATNKMGPEWDPESVVNHELKVHGIENLRVADCSVIPNPLTAHTNAPAIMIGEKASDLIKGSWGVDTK